MHAYEHITVAALEDGRVLKITLNRPKANILSMAMMSEIGAALEAHRDSTGLKLVLLRGAGGQFSFGAAVEEHTAAQAPGMLRAFHGFIRALAGFPVPVAALVEGRCLGAGFEVALACHLVFAAGNARFACPEIKLACFPPVLAAIGHLRLGGATAERLLLSGAELDAATAERLGFATIVNGAGDETEAAVLEWYRKNLAPLSARALREATRAVREASGLLAALREPLDRAEQQYVDGVLKSHDGVEGIEAFLARREPKWEDR